MPSKTVLVTNTTAGAGLAAAKSLANAGYRVTTLDSPRLPFGLRSRYSNSDFEISDLNQTDFEESTVDLLRRVRPDVFLPIGTRYVYFAAKHLERLRQWTAVNVPSLDAFMAAYIKSVCIAECRSLGIACPRSYSFTEAHRLLEKSHDVTVVVKPDSDIGAAAGIRFIRDEESLREVVAECKEQFGGTLIEEYIPGGPETMKTVVLLFSRESRPAAAFTTRKTRQWPETGGLTAVSRSTAEDDLVRQVLPFFEKWQWRGSAEVELKYDVRDGRHKVIEINPRFPGYLRFPIQCGLDLPVLAAGLTLGDHADWTSTYPAYKTGAIYVNPGLFLRTVASGLRRGGISELRLAFGDMSGLSTAVPEALADPLPLVGRALRKLGPGGCPKGLFQIPPEDLRRN